MLPAPITPPRKPPVVRVSSGTTPGDQRDYRFGESFRIGRTEDCEVCIKDEHVSRCHAEVYFRDDQWWVRDLNSSNGIFVNGERMPLVSVGQALTVRLGIYGPTVSLEVEPPPPEPKTAMGVVPSVEHYVEHYFGQAAAGKAFGEHTMMVRRAFQHVQARQQQKYVKIMAALVLSIFVAGGYALILHRQVQKQEALAQNLFYSMKSLDLNIADVEKLVAESHNQQAVEKVRNYQRQRQNLKASYDQFLTALHTYDSKMPEQKRLILRVARIFGECELAMPPDFVKEIEKYIKRWQASGRWAAAIRTATDNGYADVISKDLLAQNLPPQFFYLALQESGFDPYSSGPVTRQGIAKGMWQFIPETAVQYGLHVGPLVDLRRPDPRDDRHHWERETQAAARYLKELYTTDAQASGFLVMACYNWGEDRVLPLVRSMPANPKERNFWRLLSSYRKKLPQETYDYVLYIVSAAVIGENPRLFGFDFDNPLAHAAGER